MGYCIYMQENDFFIDNKDMDKALKALKDLGAGHNDNRARGGDGKNMTWFSWMNGVDPTSWKSLKEAMDDWRYPISTDHLGNVRDIDFTGEKIGQEYLMFKAITPYVRAGSYIQMCGEDSYVWRWVFDGKTCREVSARLVFDDGEEKEDSMSNLDTHTAYTCSSNSFWKRTVAGSTGNLYDVVYRFDHNTNIVGFQCTCPHFSYRGTECKHIKAVKDVRCGWNETLDPGIPPMTSCDGEKLCPKCFKDVYAVKVGV